MYTLYMFKENKLLESYEDVSIEFYKQKCRGLLHGYFIVIISYHGDTIYIGPMIGKGVGACVLCSEKRRNTIKPISKSFKTAPLFILNLINYIAMDLVKNRKRNEVISLNLGAEIETKRHYFFPVHNCMVCSKHKRESLTFTINYSKENKFRKYDLETLNYQLKNRLVGAEYGLIKSIKTTKLADDFFTTVSVIEDEKSKIVASAVGKNKSQSESLCILEGLERYSIFKPRRLIEFKEYRDLFNSVYIKPEAFRINFNELDNIKWIKSTELETKLPVYIPAQLVFNIDKELNFMPTSNGCSIGSTPSESCLHSLLEVIERHSLIKMWFNNESLLEIKEQVYSQYNDLLNIIEDKGYKVRIFDISLMKEVPCVWIVGIKNENENNNWPKYITSAASGFDYKHVIKRGLNELIMLIGNDYNYFRTKERIQLIKENHREVKMPEDHIYFFGYNKLGIENMGEKLSNSLSKDIVIMRTKTENMDTINVLEGLRKLLKEHGVNCYMIDITPEDISISPTFHVTKIICTNLYPLLFGYRAYKNILIDKNDSFNPEFCYGIHPLG